MCGERQNIAQHIDRKAAQWWFGANFRKQKQKVQLLSWTFCVLTKIVLLYNSFSFDF